MNKQKERKINSYHILLILAILSCLLGLTSPFLISIFNLNSTMGLDEIATWLGGSSAPLLSLASFLLIIGTLTLQRQELIAQRKELELTREEFVTQNNTIKLQRFESKFFNLINLHHEIVNSMEKPGEFHGEHGRSYFKSAYTTFSKIHTEANLSYAFQSSTDYIDVKEDLLRLYNGFFDKNEEYLGHYFRNLYHIVKLVDRTEDIILEEKRYYISLLRAQLSSYELLFLFYNALSKYACEKFKPLIDTYDLLQNINREKLLHPSHYEIYKRYC